MVGFRRLRQSKNLPKVPPSSELVSVSLSAAGIDVVTGEGSVGGQKPCLPI